MPPEDWASEPDPDTSPDSNSSYFMGGADTRCVFCRNATNSKTAEMLYMSQEWDYYYCYRCRRWFKRYYASEKVVLPVTDRTDIRHLTWAYVFRMQRSEGRARFMRSVGSVRRLFGRRPSHQRGQVSTP